MEGREHSIIHDIASPGITELLKLWTYPLVRGKLANMPWATMTSYVILISLVQRTRFLRLFFAHINGFSFVAEPRPRNSTQ